MRIIAFPRSGSHMARSIISFLCGSEVVDEGQDGQHLWVNPVEHDALLMCRHKGFIYLKRNPLDILYSRHVAEKGFDWDEAWLRELMTQITEHRRWYLSNSSLVVDYDDLNSEIINGVPMEWSKVAGLFGLSPEMKQWTEAFNAHSKRKTIEKYSIGEAVWFNERMLSSGYADGRQEFRERFAFLNEGENKTKDIIA